MKNWKNWAFVVLLSALFVEILVLFPQQIENTKEVKVSKSKSKSKKNKVPRAEGQQRAEGIHLIETQNGAADWELFAVEAEGREGAGSWSLKKVKVQYYNKDKIEFVVIGDTGVIDGKSRDMTIQGHVITESANGYRFETESVEYKSKSRLITSPSEVKMKGPSEKQGQEAGFVLTGVGMSASIDQSHMQISEKIHATKRISESQVLVVDSQSAEFSGRGKEAQFKGQVKMNYGNMTIRGDEASFLYNPKTQFLNSIQVRHNVEVTDQDKKANSENLEIDLVKNIYRFTGNPFVRQKEDELQGQEILFLDGGQKVKVLNVRARMENQK